MPKSRNMKRGGALMDTVNKSFRDVNKLLKDPENMLIALLSLVLLCLIVYYYRMNNENFEGYEEE